MKYNEQLRKEHGKLQEAEDEIAKGVIAGEVDPCAAASVVKNLPKVAFAPEKLTLGWAHRFRKAYGWVRRVLNTQGVYLDYNHPKMAASRREFQEDLDNGIDRRLYLNVDQVWRAAYSGAKHTLRKDRWFKPGLRFFCIGCFGCQDSW